MAEPFKYLLNAALVQAAAGHLQRALTALHALTQRFTAEFAIRPFIQSPSK